MSRSPEAERLLQLVADHMLEHGISGVSMSKLAKNIGTNNRMLLYYFGSKDQLFAAALATAYDRFPGLRGLMIGLGEGDDLAVQLKAGWRVLRAEQNRPYVRLFFETFALAVRDPDQNRATLVDVSSEWPLGLRAAFARHGWSPDRGALLALQVLAVWRGLQFSLLEGVDAPTLDASHDAAIDALLRYRG